MVAGRAVTPQEQALVERGKEYWTHGAGAAKINWGAPGDFYRCLAAVGEEVPGLDAHGLKGYCSNLHERALGVRPGQEDGHKHG